MLSDGSLTTFKALSPAELAQKKELQTLEGAIYRGMSELIEQCGRHRGCPAARHQELGRLRALERGGRDSGHFNLAKLICGAQGTLALTTKMKLKLVKQQGYRAMLVVFLSDLSLLPDIVHRVLPFNPESFESYDDQTFKLAVRFLPQLLSQMGLARAMRLGFSFLPEVGMVATGGIPKLVLMAESPRTPPRPRSPRRTRPEPPSPP